ncbi:DUF2142 domain-containing protein [Ottowia sp. GY511]|uniref:DUF2142 domain-containing protein n=1 Tax=Ottowia flava TaxID=2675430 RepID=A0ABW4KTF1_9BURK|nr:DUF2142 domain-containing protein [Ottowia sp. GY511]TXK33319.1 DUF2142 domain-containing protein [Ottowia sp. GY511]
MTEAPIHHLSPRGLRQLIFWWIVAMLCAALFIRLTPPFQSPDENVHLLRAAMLANGQILLQPSTDPNIRDSGFVNNDFADFAEYGARSRPFYGTEHDNGSARFSVSNIAQNHDWSGKMVLANAGGTGYYTPFIYIPHAAGIWISNQLNLNLLASYELTRALVAGLSITLAFFACSFWRPNVLVLMLLLTPMSLFQWTAPTVDGLAAALLLLLLGLWIKLFTSPDGCRLRDEVFLYGIVFILCTTRTHLLTTLMIPLSLLYHRFTWRRLAALTALVVCVLGWQVYAASVSGQTFLKRHHSTQEIILLYLQNPGEFFSALWRTWHFEPLAKFVQQGFVGLLGWSDAPLSSTKTRNIYGFLYAGTVVTILAGLPWRKAYDGIRASGIVMAMCSVLIAYFALAVGFNTYPTLLIDGIQGRYLIPVAVLAACSLGPITAGVRQYKSSELVLLTLFIPYSVYSLVELLMRYFGTSPFGRY